MSQMLMFLPILAVFGLLIAGLVFWRKVGHKKFGSGALQNASTREILDVPEEHVIWHRMTYSRWFGIAIFLGQLVGILVAVIFDKSILHCMIAGLIIPFIAFWFLRPSSVRMYEPKSEKLGGDTTQPSTGANGAPPRRSV